MITKVFSLTALMLASVGVACSVSDTTTTPETNAQTSQNSTNVSNLVLANIATATTLDSSDFFSNRDYRTTIESETPVTITFDGTSITADGSGVEISGSTVTITEEGSYILTGTLTEGQVIVHMTDETHKAQLVLDDVSIHSSTEAPIWVTQADKVFVTTLAGTTNTLSADLQEEAVSDGAVHSKCDITFNGEGTLKVNVTNGDGIVGKDELTITSGTYHITGDGCGLDSNDGVAIAGGTFVFTVEKDGIHSEHSTNTSKGYIFIMDGHFTMDVQKDGMDASAFIEVWDGYFDIKTAGGEEAAPEKTALPNTGGGGGMMGGGNRFEQTQVPEDIDLDTIKAALVARYPDLADTLSAVTTIEALMELAATFMGGNMQGGMTGMPDNMMGQTDRDPMQQDNVMGQVDRDPMQQGDMMGQVDRDPMQQGDMMGQVDRDPMQQDNVMGQVDRDPMQQDDNMMGQMQGGTNQNTTVSPDMDDEGLPSTKGIKSASDIRLFGGTFILDCYDDAIHSDTLVHIHDGDYTISTGDDGIHANWDTIITGGTVDILKSFEGIEGQRIDIRGGTIDMYCGDDGINGATAHADPENSSIYIHISGGDITMNTNAEGDGVDSNGSIWISGGNVLVSSTTDMRDTALDSQYDSIITGGTFIATGSNSGTSQNFNDGSTQGSIAYMMSSVQTGKVSLTDSKGTVLVDFEPVKQYQTVHISIPELTVGETYTLTMGSVTETIKMESLQAGNVSGGHGMTGAAATRPGR